MLYDRKIKYLDYYEGGTKVNGGGFVKLEVRENTLRIELTIRGLHPTDSFERDIVLQGAEKEEILGQICIQNGCGQFRYSCNADQGIGSTGISYSELRGIRISIGGTREILCRWDNISDRRRITSPEKNIQKNQSVLKGSKREPIVESYADNEADPEAPVYSENELNHEPKPGKAKKADEKRKEVKKEGYESIDDKDRKERNKNEIDRERQEDKSTVEIDRERQEDKNIVDIDREKQKDKENKEYKEDGNKYNEKNESQERDNERLVTDLQNEEQSDDQTKDKPDMAAENSPEEPLDVRKVPVKLMEDKWQQLSAIYPHIQPFHDERDYLSLTPSDFVLFPNKFYRAVNNSFLLHGYYNYHHLILVRIERRGEVIYYIGVPGNYFEREKQVAIMFGFESFECETEPAKTGDFGYYLMRTEL